MFEDPCFDVDGCEGDMVAGIQNSTTNDASFTVVRVATKRRGREEFNLIYLQVIHVIEVNFFPLVRVVRNRGLLPSWIDNTTLIQIDYSDREGNPPPPGFLRFTRSGQRLAPPFVYFVNDIWTLGWW